MLFRAVLNSFSDFFDLSLIVRSNGIVLSINFNSDIKFLAKWSVTFGGVKFITLFFDSPEFKSVIK